MKFIAMRFEHNERAPWDSITHVRIRRSASADTAQGQRVLEHIRRHAARDGVAPISAIQSGFPARKQHLGRRGMARDLRHMAGDRRSGISEQNKGLLDLGFLQ